MDWIGSKQQTKLFNRKSSRFLSIQRKLYGAWPSDANNNTENHNNRKHHKHTINIQPVAKKLALLVLSALTCTPSYATDVGGVSATANPIANSSGSVTNQAIQVLQGPYITNQYGNGIACQGPTMNITPYLNGTGSFKRPFERYYHCLLYTSPSPRDLG